MKNTETNSIKKLCEDVLSAIRNDTKSLVDICRSCLEIACQQNDRVAIEYFSNQLKGFAQNADPTTLTKYQRHWHETVKYFSMPIQNEINITNSLGIIEDLCKRNKCTEVERCFLINLKEVCHTWVLKIRQKLETQQIPEMFYHKVNAKINTIISAVDPSLLDIISSIAENINSKNPQNISNSVLSCRSLLQKLSDKLYPPDNTKTINGHEVGREHYKNRLIAFVKQNTRSITKWKNIEHNFDWLENYCDLFKKRISNTYDITCKGKYKIDPDEAISIVMTVYLLIYDILLFVDIKKMTKMQPRLQRPGQPLSI